METNEILYSVLGVKKELISPQYDQLIGFQRELSIKSGFITYKPDDEFYASWIIVDLLIKRPLDIEYYVKKTKEIAIMYGNSEKFIKSLIKFSLMLCPVFTFRLFKIGVFEISGILRFIWKYRSNTILSLFQYEIGRELLENMILVSDDLNCENYSESKIATIMSGVYDINSFEYNLRFDIQINDIEKYSISKSKYEWACHNDNLDPLNYCAFFGSARNFKFLLSKGMKIGYSTMRNAICSGDFELIHLVKQFQSYNVEFEYQHSQQALMFQHYDLYQYIWEVSQFKAGFEDFGYPFIGLYLGKSCYPLVNHINLLSYLLKIINNQEIKDYYHNQGKYYMLTIKKDTMKIPYQCNNKILLQILFFKNYFSSFGLCQGFLGEIPFRKLNVSYSLNATNFLASYCYLLFGIDLFEYLVEQLPYKALMSRQKYHDPKYIKSPNFSNYFHFLHIFDFFVGRKDEYFKDFVSKGFNPNSSLYFGYPPLYIAVKLNRIDIVKLLLNNGIFPSQIEYIILISFMSLIHSLQQFKTIDLIL